MKKFGTVLCDCDGVLAQCTEKWLALFEEIHGYAIEYDSVTTFKFEASVCTKAQADAVWAAVARTPGWVRDMEWIEEAKNGLAFLRDSVERVVCVTTPQAEGTWARERILWLRAAGFDAEDILLVKDKSHVDGHVLIDDGLHNLRPWKRAHPSGCAIVIDQPWNRDAAPREPIHRAYDMVEAAVLAVGWLQEHSNPNEP
jgi:5'(3')-deoxyribonucleotidase